VGALLNARVRLVLYQVVLSLALSCRSGAGTGDNGLGFLEKRVKGDSADFIAWNQLASRYLECARETGDDAWIAKASHAADASLEAIPEKPNTGGLAAQARVDLARHCFPEALVKARRLDAIRPGDTEPLPIMADALIEMGDLDEAAKVLAEWEKHAGQAVNLEPRLARLALAHGRLEEARMHLSAAAEAARKLASPSPLSVAWCEVQLGELAFRMGDWQSAENSYLAALKAKADWWSAREHLAELRAAQGRTDEAFKIYDEVIALAPRPELMQAVGDLHLFLNDRPAAKKWHDRALAAYRTASQNGSVAYYHHLAGFFCDSEPDASEAVSAARKDLELRHSGAAYDALAWALYKSGDLTGASAAATKALESGVKDSHILYHAGLIRMSAGDLPGGQAALREAAAVNPQFQAFHVHR